MDFLEWTAVFGSGLCLGSFLNVVIYRLPRGLSLVTPRSFCPSCAKRLAWYENIPLVSYFLQKGRCRSCSAKISWRYPLVEFLSGLLAVFFVFKYGLSLAAGGLYLFSLLLLTASFIDLEHGIIPDEISLGGLLLGLLFSPFNPLVGPKEAFLGALSGAGGFYLLGEFYYWLRGREGLGGGDYKFLAMIGSFLGLRSLVPVIFMASLFGIAGALCVAVRKREKLRGESAIPFGPFLALGAPFFLFLPREWTSFPFPPVY